MSRLDILSLGHCLVGLIDPNTDRGVAVPLAGA